MNPESLPWQYGISAVLATILLFIICDVAYRKWPKEMARTRRVLRQQNKLIEGSSDSNSKELQALKEIIEHQSVTLDLVLKKMNRPQRKRKTPAVRKK